jgi:hypothetical protein
MLVKDPLLQGYISKAYRIIYIAIRGYWQHGNRGKKGYFPTYLWEQTGPIKNCLKQSVWSFWHRGTNQYQLSGNLSWEADIWGK